MVGRRGRAFRGFVKRELHSYVYLADLSPLVVLYRLPLIARRALLGKKLPRVNLEMKLDVANFFAAFKDKALNLF